MLKNKKNSSNNRVKFISYTGKYPNLCSGILTLEIDGVKYKFGNEYMNYHYDKNNVGRFTDEDPEHPNFNKFWTSGGSVTYNENWGWNVQNAEWEIDVEELPEQFWDIAEEIDRVFNENIPYGCCGGCI